MTKRQQEFMSWLKKRDPFVYDVAMRNYEMKNPGMSGLSGFDFGTFIKSVGDAVAKVAPQIAQVKLLNEQIKRAKANMPPLDVQSYTSANPQYVPGTAEGQFAVDYTARSMNQGFDFMGILPWLGFGALAFLLIKRKKAV